MKNSLTQAAQDLAQGKIERRGFLRAAVGLGLSTTAAYAALEAVSGSEAEANNVIFTSRTAGEEDPRSYYNLRQNPSPSSTYKVTSRPTRSASTQTSQGQTPLSAQPAGTTVPTTTRTTRSTSNSLSRISRTRNNFRRLMRARR